MAGDHERGNQTTVTVNAKRWKQDPCTFIRELLREPRAGKPYVLFPEQERFIREAFTLTPAGRLPYSTAVYSCPKKNGKSTTAAMLAIYAAIVIGGPFAAVYILANDQDQSVGVVFELAKRTIEATPALRHSAKITATRIEFPVFGRFHPSRSARLRRLGRYRGDAGRARRALGVHQRA
jgi:hypothetical protein